MYNSFPYLCFESILPYKSTGPCLHTVSYTHLDVYKRQSSTVAIPTLLDGSWPAPKIDSIPFFPIPCPGFPVSYIQLSEVILYISFLTCFGVFPLLYYTVVSSKRHISLVVLLSLSVQHTLPFIFWLSWQRPALCKDGTVHNYRSCATLHFLVLLYILFLESAFQSHLEVFLYVLPSSNNHCIICCYIIMSALNI